MVRVGVVGTTTWGTTLAIGLARKGVDVCLLARTEQEAALLTDQGENARFVPGAKFPESLRVRSSADEALGDAALVLIVVPSKTMRDNVRKVRGSISASAIIVSGTKGLEYGTGKRMSQILQEELPPPLDSAICALSGPNLAKEIIEGKPASTVVASSNAEAAIEAQNILNAPLFRVYTNDDIIGVELGGALKNIIALGAGICDGKEYGDNAKAAFITRGLVEIARLGAAAGANPITFAGLAGVGDMIATCSSVLSRNHYVGEQLARGKTLQQIRATMRNVAEGVDTTAGAVTLSEQLNVEMPITRATYDVLFEGMPVDEAIAALLGRAPRPEWAGIDG